MCQKGSERVFLQSTVCACLQNSPKRGFDRLVQTFAISLVLDIESLKCLPNTIDIYFSIYS